MKKWRCSVCGYVHEGEEPPDQCPVCGADKSLFEEITGDGKLKPQEPPQPEKKTGATAGKAGSLVKKWRCSVCGYIHTGPEPPDQCPVCGADKSLFEELVEEDPQAGETRDISAGPSKPAGDPRKVNLGPPPDSTAGRLYHLAIGQMLKHHAHPISVHVPNGVLPISFIFVVLSILFGSGSLETAAFCNMVFVVLTLPFVLFSGYVEWQKRYRGFLTNRFLIKILCATVVAVTALVVVIWWIIDPGVLSAPSWSRWAFVLVNLIMLGAAAAAGFIGGKLVFKD
jgi:rubredoxin